MILCANLVASIAVHRSHLFASGQKFWQLLLIWGLPVIGAALALYFTIGWRGRRDGDPTIKGTAGSADGNAGPPDIITSYLQGGGHA